MPRAVDPSLFGKQLPVGHSPLNRIEWRVRKPDFDLEAFLEQIRIFVEDYLFPVIEDLTGIDLSVFLPLFTGLDFSSVEAFFSSLAEAIIATGAALLGPDSPLNALNLFNLIPTDLLAHIPVANIGTAITNLIADPDFLDAESFSGLDTWFHDLTAGFGGTGAAWTVADGTTKELLEQNPIPVSAGQVLPLSGKVKWTDLVGTGEPIALAVTGYTTTGASVQQTIASHNTIPATTDWIDLSGSYTVPDNVTALRTRLVVAPTATAGTVWFSKINATKIGPLLQRLIAGTDPGTFLPDDIANLFGGITTNALELLNKAGLGDFNDLVSGIGGPIGNQIEDAIARVNTFLDSLSPLNADNINTGNVADAFVPGLGTIHDSLVTKVGNIGGSGFDIAEVAEVLAGQTHAIVDVGAGVTNMFARISNLESKVAALPVASGGTGSGTAAGGVVGVFDTDNFERTSATTIGSDWITIYSGGAGVWAIPNGHDATFAPSGVDSRDFLCIRNNPEVLRSVTDYQRVTKELSSKATRFYDPILGTYNYTGHNDVWLRISDDTTSLANVTGIRIRYGGDGSLSITRFVAGTPTLLEGLVPGSIVPPGPGANLIGEAGLLADGITRHFRAKIGASIRLQHTETGVASGLGPTFRRWGHGGRAEGHLLPLPGQQIPGGCHYWNGMDQTLS